ncbi:nuclear transport factor 2 family protein [Aeromicrobium sp. CF3.5]|uniref:nuclear transport factor 2 family protein n=1 Tax=Aeromicrobium sp. CF3.5 TaxID=3373078 RepID=UPI003EE52E1E
MTTHVPATVESYFAVIDSDAPEKAVDSFTDDALVTDDGTTYRGRAEILAWLTGAATAFEYVSSRLSVQTTEHTTTVTNRLTGNFPGGQVDLEHVFSLDEHGLIRRLTISA